MRLVPITERARSALRGPFLGVRIAPPEVPWVASWSALGVDPGWRDELGEAVVGEADDPVAAVDDGVVVSAEQHAAVQ